MTSDVEDSSLLDNMSVINSGRRFKLIKNITQYLPLDFHNPRMAAMVTRIFLKGVNAEIEVRKMHIEDMQIKGSNDSEARSLLKSLENLRDCLRGGYFPSAIEDQQKQS
jgi:uncharacterized protein (DUF488 family)